MKQGLKQLLLSKHNLLDSDIDSLHEDFTYKVLFLSKIVPDKENSRFLPTVLISDEHAEQLVKRVISKTKLVDIYKAEDQVLVGKGLFVNCLKYGSVEWKKANENIESIIELANNISKSEIIQAPTVYPTEDGTFKVLTGHRRFLSMIYNFGVNGTGHFKVYETQPILTKLKQFQENACREDLPQYGKLEAFQKARLELSTLSDVRKQMGGKKLTVREEATLLGISMGAYDNYNVLTRYTAVLNFYQQGKFRPFSKTKKEILEIENAYRKEHNKTQLNIGDKREINQRIEHFLSGNTQKKPKPESKPQISFKGVSSPSVFQQLLSADMTKLDIGIDWSSVEWNNKASVEEVLTRVIEYLNEKQDD